MPRNTISSTRHHAGTVQTGISRGMFRYALAIGSCCLLCGICFVSGDMLHYHLAGLLMLMLTAVIPLFSGPGPSAASALVNVSAWCLLFMPPRFHLIPQNLHDAFFIAAFFVIGGAGVLSSERIRRTTSKSGSPTPQMPATCAEHVYKAIFDSLAHDLRTPITTIYGASSQLVNRMPIHADSGLQTLASDILLSVQRLNHVVGNLLDGSRLESGSLRAKPGWCDIVDILSDIRQQLSYEMRQCVLSTEIDERFPLLYIDSGLVSQAFSNIIINSLNHSPEKGIITVKARMDKTIPSITFEDDGPGFSPESIPHLFEKFFRDGDNSCQGIGLGLSIAKNFIEMNGGTIHASNRSEGGACITVSFPASQKNNSMESL